MNDVSPQPPSLRVTRTKIVVGLLILIAFFIPIPYYGPLFDRVMNAAHVYVFMGLSFVIMERLRYAGIAKRIALCAVLCLVIGLGIEIIQPLFSRRMSLTDVWGDLCGTGIGISIAVAMTLQNSVARRGMLLASAAVLLWCTYVIVLR